MAEPNAIPRGKRILITGATGFIGSALALRLHAEGAEVLALERSPGLGDALTKAGIKCVPADVTDHPRIAEIISRDVGTVMHLAAWLSGRSWRDAERVNVEGTRCLAEASAQNRVERFIFVSSVAVYGPHGDRDVDERYPTSEYGDPYGDSKIRAEAALRQVSETHALPVVVVRPGMVYGPGSPGWTVRIAHWARSGQLPILDDGCGTIYPIYVDNLIDLLALCVSHPDAPGQVFNAVDDGPVTLQEFLGAYMEMIPTRRAIRLPGWLAYSAACVIDPFFPARSYRYIVSQMRGRGMVLNQKAKDVLDWQPRVSLIAGLSRSEAWLRSEGII